MKKLNVTASALIPDVFNNEVREGWTKSHWVKVDGEKYHVVREKELRYKLLLENDDGITKSICVKLGRKWSPDHLKLAPLLEVPKCSFVFQEADEVGEPTKRVVERPDAIWSDGIWDALFQWNPQLGESRVCDTMSQYREENWIKLVPAEAVWSSIQTVRLPNWAMQCAPRRPVGITPADRAVYQAWFGHFRAKFLAYASRNGWTVDPHDVHLLFQEMTSPDAGESVEFQLDTHQLGRYILGAGELELREDSLHGVFSNYNFEFNLPLRNQFSERIVEFIM